MDLVSAETFLGWARGLGIWLDERYSEPRCLVYVPYRSHARFWAVPGRAGVVPLFVARLLSGVARWEECYLWPRGGRWAGMLDEGNPGEWVQGVILGGAGVPAEFEGAVRYEACEIDKLVAAIFARAVFGFCVTTDLFVVPDHGRYVLWVDHHDVIHVQFAAEADVEPFVRHMAAGKFALPGELPDGTFKKVDWIP